MPGDATPIVVAAKPTRDYLAALFVKNGATAARRGAAAPPTQSQLSYHRVA